MTNLMWFLCYDPGVPFQNKPTEELFRYLLKKFFDGDYKMALVWFWEVSFDPI